MTNPENEAAPTPDPAAREAEADAPQAGPYKNLWIPLVVVPAAIVAAILVVFVMFGSIAGEEHSLGDNLRTVLNGGANEREQAVFSMVRQLEQNRQAELGGQEPPWPVEPQFLGDLRSAWEVLPEDDLDARLVVATSLSQLDESEGVTRLLSLLDSGDEADPGAIVRFHALAHLGASGDPAALDALLRFLDHEDPGLRQIAVIGLQKFPGERTLAALGEALADPAFEIRANAALALSHLGDPRCAALLRDMLDASTYEAVHASNPEKFGRTQDVSQSRAAAALGLGELGLQEDLERLRRMAREEDDLTVREAAMRAVQGRGEGSDG